VCRYTGHGDWQPRLRTTRGAPIFYKERGATGGAGTPRLFGLWGHPNTVLIDRKGRVAGVVRGERDWQSDAAHQLVRQLLEDG